MMIKTNTNNRIFRAAAIAAACCSVVLAQAQAQPQPKQTPAPAQAQVQQPPPPPAAPVQGGLDADWGNAMGAPAPAPASSAGVIETRGEVRRGTELSAQALASAPYLLFERDVKGHSSKLVTAKEKAAYQRFDKALVKLWEKAEFKVGDTVDIISSDGLLKFKKTTAQLVTRRGRAVVEDVIGKKTVVIRLTEMWGVVQGGESIVPMARFEPVYCDNLVAPDVKIEASVVRRIDDTVTPYLHQHFIIDKGANDGIRLGDFFKVVEKRPADKICDDLLEAQVVNVTPVSATLVIQKLFKNSLKNGDLAHLSRRSAQ